MARMTVKTAQRSVADLLGRLPRDSVVELTKTGLAPPGGAAASIKIEIAALPFDLKTHDKPDDLETKRHEDLQG